MNSGMNNRIGMVWVLACCVGQVAVAHDTVQTEKSQQKLTQQAISQQELTQPAISKPELSPWRYWPPGQRASQQAFESALNATPSAASLRANHELVTREPHIAGTDADHRLAALLADKMEAMGLEVERQEIWPYLAYPVTAEVELITPERVMLPVKESAVAGDPFSSHPEVSIGWNAYSASGEVTGEVVYANYGTKEDFERLKKFGIDLSGKIVLARYGRNFRGYKAKFAQAAGAIALIIYSDPADSGYVRGLMYPEGGYATPTYIQRGGIGTWNHVGDPLTPFIPATRDADRVDPESIGLPKIPVHPIGWGAAQEILSRMKGTPVPTGWQGGLPFTYRLVGGSGLTVRVMVRQDRRLAKTHNIVGRLRGSKYPEQLVIVGCHYDAWTFGAGDPHAGTMVLMEVARSFAKRAKAGHPPERTIVFAHWGAEEFGIIGSVEWVEAHRDELSKNAVAYINLDMAVMGPHFGASASPSLKTIIAEATQSITHTSNTALAHAPGDDPHDKTSVFDAWMEKGGDDILPGQPRFGNLGGGSDHVGFYCHLCIPSAGLSSGGGKGVSYHSAYDNIAWYQKVVGDDYKSAVMVTNIVNTVTARLANGAILPLDPVRYVPDFLGHIMNLSHRASSKGMSLIFKRSTVPAKRLQQRAESIQGELFDKVAADALSPGQYACVNEQLLRMERCWEIGSGLPERPWYKNMFASTDPNSGYSAWMLPAIRYGIEHRNVQAVMKAQLVHKRIFGRMEASLDAIEACWDPSASKLGR